MRSRPIQALVEGLKSELRSWAEARRLLLWETAFLAFATACLVHIVPVLAQWEPDGRLPMLALMVVHAVAVVMVVQHAVNLLARECPRCRQNFYGLPRAVPYPARRSCASCALPLLPPPGPDGPDPEAEALTHPLRSWFARHW